MRGLSRKWVWRCAADSTPAASIGFAEVAIGGAGGEAALRLHGFELGGEGLRARVR
jgi:hypothetical protein